MRSRTVLTLPVWYDAIGLNRSTGSQKCRRSVTTAVVYNLQVDTTSTPNPCGQSGNNNFSHYYKQSSYRYTVSRHYPQQQTLQQPHPFRRQVTERQQFTTAILLPCPIAVRRLSLKPRHCNSNKTQQQQQKQQQQHRSIQSEREYITTVTHTLQTIHDTVDNILDQQTFITDYEISFSQGVLTMKFPPHGTWVLNQQIPNLQIWVRVINDFSPSVVHTV
jgi:Frataxin-like domain